MFQLWSYDLILRFFTMLQLHMSSFFYLLDISFSRLFSLSPVWFSQVLVTLISMWALCPTVLHPGFIFLLLWSLLHPVFPIHPHAGVTILMFSIVVTVPLPFRDGIPTSWPIPFFPVLYLCIQISRILRTLCFVIALKSSHPHFQLLTRHPPSLIPLDPSANLQI